MPEPGTLLRSGRYLAVAYEFIGTIAAAAVAGWLLDTSLGWGSWAYLGCILAGVVGAFIRLIQTLRRFDRLDGTPRP